MRVVDPSLELNHQEQENTPFQTGCHCCSAAAKQIKLKSRWTRKWVVRLLERSSKIQLCILVILDAGEGYWSYVARSLMVMGTANSSNLAVWEQYGTKEPVVWCTAWKCVCKITCSATSKMQKFRRLRGTTLNGCSQPWQQLANFSYDRIWTTSNRQASPCRTTPSRLRTFDAINVQMHDDEMV